MSKVVIITGAGKRLGKAFAIGLSRPGHNVVASGTNQAELDELANRLEGEYLTQVCDITNIEDCKKLIAAVKDKFGRVDVLINNAAVYEEASLVDTPVEKVQQVMSVVVNGSTIMSKLALEAMTLQQSGQIISMLDIVTKTGLPKYDPEYPNTVVHMAKSAKTAVTKVIRREAEQHNVIVTSFYLKWAASDIDIDDESKAPEGATHPADAVKYMVEAIEKGQSEVIVPASK